MDMTPTSALMFLVGLIAGFVVGKLAGEDWAEERTFAFLTGKGKI